MKVAVYKHAPAATLLCLHPLWRTLRRVAGSHTVHFYLRSALDRVPALGRLDRMAASAMMPGPVKAYGSMRAPETAATIAGEGYDLVIPDGLAGILPASIVALPRLGTMAFHYGKLPEMRGIDTIEWCLLRGERPWTTVLFYDAGIDTGDIIAVAQLDHDPPSLPHAHRAIRRLSWRLMDRVFADSEAACARRRPQRPEDGVTYYALCPPLRALLGWRIDGRHGPPGGAAAANRLLSALPPRTPLAASAGDLGAVLKALKAPDQEIHGGLGPRLVSALHFFHRRKEVAAALPPVILAALREELRRPQEREDRLRLFNELALLVGRPDRYAGILGCAEVQGFIRAVVAAEWG